MKKCKLLGIFFIACILFVSCSSSREGQITPLSRGEIQNMSDPNRNTYISFNQVKQNDEWDISLSENPTTGYSWLLYISGSGSIATVYDDYKSPFYDENNPIVGAGGTHTWHFKAGNKGEVTLTFVYQRLWENGNPIETRTYRYLVI